MRRTPSTEITSLRTAEGATARPGFDAAYRRLAQARAAYDAAAGDPARIAELARAAADLDDARRAIRTLPLAA